MGEIRFRRAWDLAYMVECPNCGTKYSKKLLKCPECETLNPNLEKAVSEFEEFTRKLKAYLVSGDGRDES